MSEEETNRVGEILAKVAPKYKDPVAFRKTGKYSFLPHWEHKLIYDSTSETLEPLYFWILDFMAKYGFKEKYIEKLVDNFVASPGSGFFAEIGARMTRMQEEGMKILGVVNQVIKSIMNIIYDLREFDIRLSHYDTLHSEKESMREAGMLALKQIWMDNVDIKRGAGSINQMTYQLGFTTLRDAFMKAKDVDDVEAMDLNERVKRVLKPRVSEFFQWVRMSEEELRKRFSIETSYLKSQKQTLKLYSRWARPYLTAAEQLMMTQRKTPALITTFNTSILEFMILGRRPIDVEDAAYNKELPPQFAKAGVLKRLKKREYYSCVLMDFTFRGIPQRISQQPHYVFGGRAEVVFWAFALNDDEVELFKSKMDKSDLNAALGMVDELTTESLDKLEEDIDYFIDKAAKEKKKEEEEAEVAGQENPFTALFSFAGAKFGQKKELSEAEKKSKEKTEKAEKIKVLSGGIEPDSFEESIVRNYAQEKAAAAAFKIYDIFKKGHDMASYPDPFDEVHFRVALTKPSPSG